jgi:catechol 2,3-dioxygenase-like lactoylglutathione lyase family enzyme
MDSQAAATPRRHGALAVHSLQRFVFSVPDLPEAAKFYRAFGLDVRDIGGRLDLHAFGHPHRWGSIRQRPGGKRLEYITFGAYPEDFDALTRRFGALGVSTTRPHPLADDEGVWITDPEGIAVQVVRAANVAPASKASASAAAVEPGKGAAPARSKAGTTRPRRLSHILMFSSDVPRSMRFYCDVLGLRLSDRSGDVIGFLHGAHGSDHHMLAFAKSDGPGLHHSSWDVAGIDAVGIGMEQMAAQGFPDGWGVGRHVIGSNYFRYVRDPWGSFAEYSADIDHIPADVEWHAADHPPEDSFYVWGPPVPDYFIVNHETAVRKAAA